jgi:hypothetical protein
MRPRLRSRAAAAPKITTNDLLDAGPRTLIRNNRNWLSIICGPTGTGKSFVSLRLAELLDPTFNLNRIVFSTDEFLEVFPQCEAGQVIIFEESEELNSRRAMKEANVQMGIILSMIRFTQVSVLFNLPAIQMIDINARRLMHTYLYTVEVDRTRCPPWQRNKTGVYWYNVRSPRIPSQNSDDGLKFVNPVVRGVKVRKAWFQAPSPALLAAYQERKHRVFYNRLAEAQTKLGLSGAAAASTVRATRDVPRPPAGDPGIPEDLLANDAATEV